MERKFISQRLRGLAVPSKIATFFLAGIAATSTIWASATAGCAANAPTLATAETAATAAWTSAEAVCWTTNTMQRSQYRISKTKLCTQ